jgi:hypothetical protein
MRPPKNTRDTQLNHAAVGLGRMAQAPKRPRGFS